MGIKGKVVGFLAAVGLSMSMMAGVSAEGANTNATVSVHASTCSVSVSSGSISFGSWRYDGTEYTHISGLNNNTLMWQIVAGSPAGCTTSLTFGGLSSSTTSTPIGLSNFSGAIGVVGGGFSHGNLSGSFLDPATPQSYVLPTTSVIGVIQLDSVPNTTMPGFYTGDIKATVINAQ